MSNSSDMAFVNRDSELATLEGYLERAIAGNGGVVFVTGETGIGKTAFVRQFLQRIQERYPDLVAAIGECNIEIGVDDGYLPFVGILGQLLGGKADEVMVTRENIKRLRSIAGKASEITLEVGPELIGTFVPPAGLVLKGTVAIARALGLVGKPRLSEDSHLAQIGQTQIFEQYTQVLTEIAEHVPLVVVVEDLQWADASSLNLLFHLGRNVDEGRILIIGTYRPSDVAIGRGAERHPLESVRNELARSGAKEISLDWPKADLRRSQERIKQFVHKCIDGEYDPNSFSMQFKDLIVQRTEGNPLFVVELLKYLEESRQIVRSEKQWQLALEIEDIGELPTSVAAVIRERVGRLEEELRGILECASVEGNDFTAQIVARVQQLNERDLLRRLSKELDKIHQLVVEKERKKIDHKRLYLYRFRHSLIQQHLYNELSYAEKELMHRDIGLCMEELYSEGREKIAAQLARHFKEAGDYPRVVDYATMASRREYTQHAISEASTWCEIAQDALDQLPDTEENARRRYRITVQRGKILDYEGNWEDAYSEYQECQEIAFRLDDPRLQAIAYNLMANVKKRRGDYPGALELFNRSVGFSKQADCPEETAKSYNSIGIIYRMQEEYPRALEFYEKCLQIRNKLNDELGIAFVLNNKGKLCRFIGEYDEALRYYEEALGIRKHFGNKRQIGETLRNLGEIYRLRGIYDKATVFLQESLAAKEEAKDEYGTAKTLNEMAMILILQGDISGALSSCNRALGIRRRIKYKRGISESLLVLATIYKAQGSYDAALEECEESLSIQRELGYEGGIVENLILSSEILLEQGKLSETLDIFRDAGHRAKQLGRQHEYAHAQRNIGAVYIREGHPNKAVEYLDDALARYEKLRAHHDIAVTCVELASAHSKLGDESNAGTTLERAITLANAYGYQDVFLRISDNFPENTDSQRMAPNP